MHLTKIVDSRELYTLGVAILINFYNYVKRTRVLMCEISTKTWIIFIKSPFLIYPNKHIQTNEQLR
jgi:hypothetical protein